MKATKVILKILAAVAAVAGVVYVVATYGDKIVAWARDMIACVKEKLGLDDGCCCCCEGDCCCEDDDCQCEEGQCCCDCQDEGESSEVPAAPEATEADFEN